MTVKKYLVALCLLTTLLSEAHTQGYVYQSGGVTPGHAVQWTTSGVIQDAGTAASGNLTSLGVTNNSGPGICVSTGLVNASGRQQLCLSASLNGAGVISLQNYGTATAQNLEFIVNGSTTVLPSGSTNIPAIKPPVDVATTANITLSGEQTIDGVLTSGSRVLVKNQSTASQNGIYVSSSGAWSLAADFNSTNQMNTNFKKK